MKARLSLLLVLAVGLAFSPPAAADQAAAAPAPAANATPSAGFRNHDRWCAIGDSITHSGTYHEWIELYYITRLPGAVIDVFNCGISGDRAAGGLQRLGWDVLPHQPTVATIMFGMNDVERALYTDDPPTPEILGKRKAALESYQQNQRALVAALQKAGVRVILLTPSIFDETAEEAAPKQTGVNGALGDCAAFVKQLGAETGCAVIDFYRPMNLFTQSRQAKDPKFTMVGPDRIHPGPAGHLAMAYLFLQAQGAPSDVARLSLDARTARVVGTPVHGTATNVRAQGAGLAFTWSEHALPFPIDPDCAPALEWVSFNRELNQEVLQVSGLKPGRYALRIDGVEVHTYSAEELAAGANLAEEPRTPQYQQALEVLRLLNSRTKLVSSTLRSLAHVEHQSAPNIAHPVTLEQMKPYLAQRLERFKTNPPAPSTLQGVKNYPILKAREAESLAESVRLTEQARRVATPRPHDFVLTAE
ncbi:MAG TPA: SGNH/GDSL hydrolase family protein [Opitutaceae bacterium]|nr:SGNH/GDSL hydrolase family protein [Opitutaceae bacterium]